MSGRRWLPAEYLLPLACLASAAVLAASELMVTFELTPPGGEAQRALDAIDRHSGALLVLAAFAVVGVCIAVVTGSKPAAMAVAACGVVSLLIFLLADLPDAGQIGDISDEELVFINAKTEPQAGFWLELLGAVGLALTGIALATLSPDQLRAPLDGMRPGRRGERLARGPGAKAPGPGAGGRPAHMGNPDRGSGGSTERGDQQLFDRERR